jgi:hypothetical protein
MPTKEQLAQRAREAESAFREALAALQAEGKVDNGEWDANDFENMKVQRDGMIRLGDLAETALSLAQTAHRCELESNKANYSLLKRLDKKSEADGKWGFYIQPLITDLKTFRMLTPTIDDNWYKDPTGRHEKRYRGIDGWTDKVKDGELESTNPF